MGGIRLGALAQMGTEKAPLTLQRFNFGSFSQDECLLNGDLQLWVGTVSSVNPPGVAYKALNLAQVSSTKQTLI